MRIIGDHSLPLALLVFPSLCLCLLTTQKMPTVVCQSLEHHSTIRLHVANDMLVAERGLLDGVIFITWMKLTLSLLSIFLL